MARLHKIKISKIENEVKASITVNAKDIEEYIANGWTAETEPYIDEPVSIQAPVDDDEIEAQADDEIKATVDEDLLIE